jgi:hypothetical protein
MRDAQRECTRKKLWLNLNEFQFGHNPLLEYETVTGTKSLTL